MTNFSLLFALNTHNIAFTLLECFFPFIFFILKFYIVRDENPYNSNVSEGNAQFYYITYLAVNFLYRSHFSFFSQSFHIFESFYFFFFSFIFFPLIFCQFLRHHILHNLLNKNSSKV